MYHSEVKLNGNTKIGHDCVDAQSKKAQIEAKASVEMELYGEQYPEDKVIPITNPRCENCDCELDKIKGEANLYKCENCSIAWEYLGMTGTKPVWVCIFDPRDVG